MDQLSSKTKTGILIFVIVLVLAGGSFAAWMVLRKKEEDPPPENEALEKEELPPITGRVDARTEETDAITEDLVARLLGQQEQDPNRPRPRGVLQTSSEGKALIEERVKYIQMNESASNQVRAIHRVGRTLVDTSSWTSKAIDAFGDMFGQLHNVDKGNYLTYPIFGKYETKGVPLRAELQKFLDKDWRGYNLSMKRHHGNAHWIGQLSLNLIYGSQSSHVHSADNIYWYIGGKTARKGIDFFKAVNGHDIEDKKLLKMQDRNGKAIHNNLQINAPGTTGIYGAGVMYAFVKSWMAEMDYFDKVTEQTAIEALIKEGALFKVENKNAASGATKGTKANKLNN
jgi:hypothetical protein